MSMLGRRPAETKGSAAVEGLAVKWRFRQGSGLAAGNSASSRSTVLRRHFEGRDRHGAFMRNKPALHAIISYYMQDIPAYRL